MTKPNECPRCGATTPHQTFAELAAVNIEQEKELTRLRAALKVFASNASWDHYERFSWEWDNDIHNDPQVFAAAALEGRDK